MQIIKTKISFWVPTSIWAIARLTFCLESGGIICRKRHYLKLFGIIGIHVHLRDRFRKSGNLFMQLFCLYVRCLSVCRRSEKQITLQQISILKTGLLQIA